MIRSRTYIATPPGATIKEQLVDRGMSQKEFACRMDMSEKHISRLINGEVQLTPEMAMRLEMVLGIPAHFWNNLEAIYREKLVLTQVENEMDEDVELAKKYPYKEMAKYGWVPKAGSNKDKVLPLRKHFEVVKLSLVQGSLIPGIACRRLAITEKANYALLAWAQRAKIEARNVETRPLDLQKLKNMLPEIRKMTKQDPEEFCPELSSKLADCGIALVFLPHIGGSFLHGATFYDKNKIVIGLTVRGKDADKFWFSLFHELAHVLLGHVNNSEGTTDEEENEADRFAGDILIPLEKYRAFIQCGRFSKEDILVFADEIDIDSGIVVGRLQKDNYIKYSWYNDLKVKYEISA